MQAADAKLAFPAMSSLVTQLESRTIKLQEKKGGGLNRRRGLSAAAEQRVPAPKPTERDLPTRCISNSTVLFIFDMTFIHHPPQNG